jgi:hypothetical protein
MLGAKLNATRFSFGIGLRCQVSGDNYLDPSTL